MKDAILISLSKIYGAVSKFVSVRYFNGQKKRIKLNKSTISIGNISMGGSGKTPFTIALTEICRELGYKPAIISRGYKRKSKGLVVVCDGKKILANALTGGDEPYLIAKKTMAPSIVSEKKYLAAIEADKMIDIDTIIIDDGFSHYPLTRDLDILIIDEKTAANPFPPPKGRLREDIKEINRADIIALSGNFELSDNIKSLCKSTADFIRIKTKIGELYNYFDLSKPFDNSLKTIALSGIANSDRFLNSLSEYRIVKQIAYPDHFKYSNKIIIQIIQKAKENGVSQIITTEKDAVKLEVFQSIFESEKINIFALPIKTEIIEGLEILRSRIKSLKKI